jgi:hypothetical protein
VFTEHLRSCGVLGHDVEIKPQTRVIGLKAQSIRSFQRYLGYLIVATEGGGLHLISAADPRESSHVVVPGLEGQDVRFVAVPPKGDSRRKVLVSTTKGVALVDLLPEVSVAWLYENTSPRQYSFGAFVRNGALVFACTAGEATTQVSFMREPLSSPNLVSSEQVSGLVAPDVIALEDGRVFFRTRLTGFLYGSETREVREYACLFPLDQAGIGQNFDGRVFVPAEENMGVFQIASGDFWKLGAELIEPFSYVLDAQLNRLLVTDNDGLKVVNSQNGDLMWDSAKAIGATLVAGSCAPVLTADGVLVAGATTMGQSRLVRMRPQGAHGDLTVLVGGLEGRPRALVPTGTGLAMAVDVPGLHPEGRLLIVETA